MMTHDQVFLITLGLFVLVILLGWHQPIEKFTIDEQKAAFIDTFSDQEFVNMVNKHKNIFRLRENETAVSVFPYGLPIIEGNYHVMETVIYAEYKGNPPKTQDPANIQALNSLPQTDKKVEGEVIGHRFIPMTLSTGPTEDQIIVNDEIHKKSDIDWVGPF